MAKGKTESVVYILNLLYGKLAEKVIYLEKIIKSAHQELFSAQPVSQYSQSKSSPFNYFLATIIFYLVYLFLLEGEYITSGEMYAEMATNFFPVAQSGDLVVKLISTDAGYIPLPQRIIAAISNYFSISAIVTPYFYTWTAIILTSLLVAVFCLSTFRPLIPSDSARFLICILTLTVANFELRTFVNFTYFGAFFCSVLVLIAITPKADDAPKWSWVAPLLMISKPYMLTLVPAISLAIIVAKPRFRLLMILCLVAALFQSAQLVYHTLIEGTMSHFRLEPFTIFDKISAVFLYFFGFLGSNFIGPNRLSGLEQVRAIWLIIMIGLAIFLITMTYLIRNRTAAGSMLLVGLSLVFFTVLFNVFALTKYWIDPFDSINRINSLPLYRHTIVAFFGSVIIYMGCFQILTNSIVNWKNCRKLNPTIIMVMLVIVWFLGSGWAKFGPVITKTLVFPFTGSSNWSQMAAAIEIDTNPICIMIDPYPWVFQRNCRALNSIPPYSDLKFKINTDTNSKQVYALPVSHKITNSRVVSIGMVLYPSSIAMRNVKVRVLVNLDDGTQTEFIGSRKLPLSGGVVMMSGIDAKIGIEGIIAAQIITDIPVSVMAIKIEDTLAPALIWFGN